MNTRWIPGVFCDDPEAIRRHLDDLIDEAEAIDASLPQRYRPEWLWRFRTKSRRQRWDELLGQIDALNFRLHELHHISEIRRVK